MIKSFLVLGLAFSFNAIASDFNVRGLKIGDRLEGHNKITKRECRIDVLKKEKFEDQQTIVIVLDGKENEEIRLRYRKGLLTYEYVADLQEVKDPKNQSVVKSSAILKTGKISDMTTFRIIQETTTESSFSLNTLVNCQGLVRT